MNSKIKYKFQVLFTKFPMFNYLTKPTDNVPDAILNTMGKIKKKKKHGP